MRNSLGVAKKDQIIGSDNVRWTLADSSSRGARAWLLLIRGAKFLLPEKVARLLLKGYNQRYAIASGSAHNALTVASMTALAKVLTGYITDITDVQVNKVALGTGTNTPATSDTQLQTESYRKAYASVSYSSYKAYITAFYDTGDTNGTFYEHGCFMDGTASANTGTLLSRVLLNGVTGVAKTALQTLTVEHEISLTPT